MISLLILLALALLSGAGLLLARLLLPEQDGVHILLSAFWLGWALTTGLLQLWHFFLPVNLAVLGLVAGLSAAGWVSFLARRKRLSVRIEWLLLIFACLPVFVLANQSLYAQPYYDHGLYHMQTVKWSNQFAIVPGLGNLQHRLAFNSSQYLFASLLNVGPLKGYAYYITNTSLMLALAAQGVVSLWRWLKNESRGNQADLFYALALPLVLWQSSALAVSGYAADIAVFALQFVIVGRLLRLIERPLPAGTFRSQSAAVALLLAAGMTVKLSFWVFAAAAAAILAGLWFSVHRRQVSISALVLSWLGVLALYLLPWLGRNAILSGYLLYPTRLLPLDVTWRMPDFLVSGISGGIVEWARTYAMQIPYTGDWAWFTAWLKRLDYEPRLALIIAGSLLAVLLAFSFSGRRNRTTDAGGLCVFSCGFISTLYWFFTAPAYRFSGAAIWLLLLGVALWGYGVLAERFSIRHAWRAAVGLTLFFFFAFPAHFSKNLSLSTILAPKLEPQIAAEQQALSGLAQQVTDYGATIYMPAERNNELCWDFPLPCTTPHDYFAGLRMFDVDDLQKGFYIIPSP